MNEQELQLKFQIIEQQAMQLQQQFQAINEAILEISSLKEDLDELITKKDKEILAPIGRGIYAKTKLISEELLVDIGEKSFVNKTIPQTKEIIQKQILKLEESKNLIESEIEKLSLELNSLFSGHSHSHKCHCEDKESCECENEKDCDCNEEDCSCEHEHSH